MNNPANNPAPTTTRPAVSSPDDTRQALQDDLLLDDGPNLKFTGLDPWWDTQMYIWGPRPGKTIPLQELRRRVYLGADGRYYAKPVKPLAWPDLVSALLSFLVAASLALVLCTGFSSMDIPNRVSLLIGCSIVFVYSCWRWRTWWIIQRAYQKNRLV